MLSLASPFTSFIGREREVARVVELLAAARLVTLTGPGGSGKTRLALAIAERAPGDGYDAALFVSLAPISDATLVATTIAGAFGIRDAKRPLREGLIEALAARRVLLVLDNFEQVLPAAALVSDLLAACPHLTILVTSRAVLHVSGEHVYRVPPLALPDLGKLPPLKQLGTIAAVRLFVERAQAANADFQLTDERAAAVAAICARLDGLPLAIELAAARTSVLAPQALLAKLDDQLRLLTGGPRDAPMRQRTLRDTIAWSDALLSGTARQLFRQLAVFAGGWSLEAAEAVCALTGDMDVFEGLAMLVDHSLVRQREDADGSTRFDMLETLREYGTEQLAAAGELDPARQRHAAYILELAERAAPQLYGPRQQSWFARLDAEYNNVRAALAYALEHAPLVALRLAGALGWYWYIRVPFAEGLQWLQAALARTDETAGVARAWALTAEGTLLRELSHLDAAARALDEALRLFDAHGDIAGTVRAGCAGLCLAVSRPARAGASARG